MKKISHKKIKAFLVALFESAKVPREISNQVVDGLLYASLRGIDSHGIRLATHYLEGVRLGRINISPKIIFKKTGPSTGVINADNTFGIIAGIKAMESAIKIASKQGVAVVTVKNSTHFGAAGIFSNIAAQQGLIGLSFTHSDSFVVPFGAKTAFLGTNPICFAAPVLGEDPFCLDMATSNISWNKLMMYKNQKEVLPYDCAVDGDGLITTYPEKACALTSFGGYKGYGLGLMVEILCSILTGMPYGTKISKMFPVSKNKRLLGHCFVAIDIKKFQPLKVFKKRMKFLLNDLRALEPVKGTTNILCAGDPEKAILKERLKSGIPLSPLLFDEFRKLAEYYKITPI